MPRLTSVKEYAQLRSILIAARESKNLTQTEVASRLSKPQSFVAKYEGGDRRLDVIEFIRVCEAIGVRPADVLSKIVVGK